MPWPVVVPRFVVLEVVVPRVIVPGVVVPRVVVPREVVLGVIVPREVVPSLLKHILCLFCIGMYCKMHSIVIQWRG